MTSISARPYIEQDAATLGHVLAERDRQVKTRGYDATHDDAATAAHWSSVLQHELAGISAAMAAGDPAEARRILIEMAAVGVAWISSLDRQAERVEELRQQQEEADPECARCGKRRGPVSPGQLGVCGTCGDELRQEEQAEQAAERA